MILINMKFQWFKLFLLSSSFFTLNNANEDFNLITIKKINHTLCLTNDYASPYFLNPPSNHSAVKPSKSVVDGWLVKNSEDFFHGPIEDSRFEDLETLYSNYILYNLTKSLAISLYTYNLSGNIDIYIDDIDESMDFLQLKPNSQNYWTHFSIIINDEKYVCFYQDGKILRNITNFNPKRIIIMTETETFYKVHNYQFYYSETASTEPTEIVVADQCLLLYYHLCSSCRLNVYVTNSKNYSFSRINTEEWQVGKLHVDSSQNILNILNTQDDEREKGFWAFELRKCPKMVNDAVIYEFLNEDGVERSCQEMYSLSSNEVKQKALHDQLLECDPGFLGYNCIINCKDILGSDNTYCKGYKICVDNNCVCSWGSKGEFCDRECKVGKWGPDCSHSCSRNSSKNYDCDKFTGKNTYITSPFDEKAEQVSNCEECTSEADLTDIRKVIKEDNIVLIGIPTGVEIGIAAAVLILLLYITITRMMKNEQDRTEGNENDQKKELIAKQLYL